jgi:arylsulfatase A-like enzyme
MFPSWIIKRPGGRLQQPEHCQGLANLTDILPSCLDAAGLPPMDSDGKSLIKTDEKRHRDYTFAEGEGYVACTDGRYKYVHVQKEGENFREFTDKDADPDEFDNYLDDPSFAGILNNLKEKVIEHFMPRVLP